MFNKYVLLVCTTSLLVVLVLEQAAGDLVHPPRPEKFTSEAQLKKYLRELKQYYEENVRVGRYGKRNFGPPAMLLKSYPRQEDREWKNEYDYYAQFNI